MMSHSKSRCVTPLYALTRINRARIVLEMSFWSSHLLYEDTMRSAFVRMLCLVVLLLAVVNANAGFSDPNFVDGRTVIVHLFEWKWPDIAEECERFLGPYGFAGVQVSPPNEHKYIENGDPLTAYPWWQRYQPVSYHINSRSGQQWEFQDMVERCNKVGVRIYVDAVINHMANDNTYYFPEVPYHREDFNVPNGKCSTTDGEIKNYSNAKQVRQCNLNGLDDLDYSKPGPIYHVTNYLNTLLSFGVAGFRIDAAKHMYPTEIERIVNGLRDCTFGGRPYIFQEVIDQGGEPIKATEYTHLGDVTEFRFCKEIAKVGKATTLLKYFQNFGQAWDMLPSSSALVFVDNHDNQRGHGGAGDILHFSSAAAYKKATAFALAWNYGTSRIMSSYKFDNGDQGPPSGTWGNTLSPQFNSDSSCKGDWVCEHRWRQIRNMACFRNAAGSSPVSNWFDNGNNFIAFSRGNRAFFALSNEGREECHWLQTGLPGGTYCDLISSDPTDSGCTGSPITVYQDGKAQICLKGGEDSMVALTYKATSGSGGGHCKW